MRSHQTSRTWQISHFGIKYEFGISFKREKKMDAEDKILMMGYLLMKKRRNHQQQKQWSEKYFCWITRCHSSFVVTRHSLSLVVPLFVTCWHSLSLNVPLVCRFISDPFSTVLSSSKVYQILFVHAFLMV